MENPRFSWCIAYEIQRHSDKIDFMFKNCARWCFQMSFYVPSLLPTYRNVPTWRSYFFQIGLKPPPRTYRSHSTPRITPWKINIAPENIPYQKESSLPTIIFQGRTVKLRVCIKNQKKYQIRDSASDAVSNFDEYVGTGTSLTFSVFPTTPGLQMSLWQWCGSQRSILQRRQGYYQKEIPPKLEEG